MRKNKQKTVVNEDRLEQYFGADTKSVVKKMKYGDTSLKHERMPDRRPCNNCV